MKKTRFIKSVTETATQMARDPQVAMPWERGARRAAFIARRKTPVMALRRA